MSKTTESMNLLGASCPRCSDPRTTTHRKPNGQWIQQCKHCMHIWNIEPPKFFQGEIMKCVMCEREEKSDPSVNSEWTVLELDGVPYYCCPDCLQKNAKDLSGRYQAVIEKIMDDRRKTT